MAAEVSDRQACSHGNTSKTRAVCPGTVAFSVTHLCDPKVAVAKTLADLFWLFLDTCVSAFAALMRMKITFPDISRIGIYTCFCCGAFAKTALCEIFHASYATFFFKLLQWRVIRKHLEHFGFLDATRLFSCWKIPSLIQHWSSSFTTQIDQELKNNNTRESRTRCKAEVMCDLGTGLKKKTGWRDGKLKMVWGWRDVSLRWC